MMERRRSKRRKFSYYMRITDSETQKPVGHLADVSPSGFMVDSPNPIPIGLNFSLRLDLTSEIANKNYMVFLARSKWCRPDRIDPFIQNVGFEIVNMTPQDATIYQRIVERYGT